MGHVALQRCGMTASLLHPPALKVSRVSLCTGNQSQRHPEWGWKGCSARSAPGFGVKSDLETVSVINSELGSEFNCPQDYTPTL